MGFVEVVTLVLAIYGAVVATVLAAREIRRDRRKISVILEHVAFYERAQVVITNVGFRPITITEISLAVGMEQDGETFYDQVPRNALFGPDMEGEPFPATLGDGEHLALLLSDPVSHALFEGGMNAQLLVYDVEGNEYNQFKTRLYNPKWGAYSEFGQE